MQYSKIKYPDGQISVKITDWTFPYIVTERINSYEDLFLVRSIAEALDSQNIKNRHLFIPCLFGQRSDRRFADNQSFDLKIIADFINSCGFADVSIVDPHSDVAVGLIHNAKKVSPFEWIERSVAKRNLVLVSPDAGAYKKVHDYASKLNLPVVAAVKFRDKNGALDIKFIGDLKDQDCMIVDDLADGGGTFVALAEQLIKCGAKSVELFVTHGFFTKGFDELKKHIDRIYCTNSVKDIDNDYVKQFRIL